MMRQSSEPYDGVCGEDLVLTSFPMDRVCARLSGMSRHAFCHY
jgi:hypothetical protein